MKTIHGRIGALAVVCLTGVLLIPSTALAGHDVGIYKVEKHVDLEQDVTSASVACNSGDIAMDGMWRIDHVDQDNDWGSNVLNSIDVLDSYASSADARTWNVKFVKHAVGRAQAKIFATCINGSVGTIAGHLHAWQFDPTGQETTSGTGVGFGTGYGAFDSAPTTGGRPGACPAKTVLIQPGFTALDEDNYGRLYASNPSADLRSWTWAFAPVAGATSSNYDFTWRCLKLRSPSSGSPAHTHKLVFWKKTFKATTTTPIPAGQVEERRIACGEHYKAVLGGFVPAASDSGRKMRFLGMDPRPKKRAFRFLNEDTVGHATDLYAVCLNDRTT